MTWTRFWFCSGPDGLTGTGPVRILEVFGFRWRLGFSKTFTVNGDDVMMTPLLQNRSQNFTELRV